MRREDLKGKETKRSNEDDDDGDSRRELGMGAEVKVTLLKRVSEFPSGTKIIRIEDEKDDDVKRGTQFILEHSVGPEKGEKVDWR